MNRVDEQDRTQLTCSKEVVWLALQNERFLRTSRTGRRLDSPCAPSQPLPNRPHEYQTEERMLMLTDDL
jgi:hypothetical protein